MLLLFHIPQKNFPNVSGSGKDRLFSVHISNLSPPYLTREPWLSRLITSLGRPIQWNTCTVSEMLAYIIYYKYSKLLFVVVIPQHP